MLRLYSSNQAICLLLLPLLAAGITGPAFFSPPPYFQNTNYPAQWIASALSANSWLAFASVMLLILTGALLANRVFNRHEFHSGTTYMPALIYTISASALFALHREVLPLVSHLPVLLGIHRFVGVYHQPKATRAYFEGGFWFGLSALLFPPYILLGMSLWAAVMYTRSFNWREYLLSAMAWSLPWIYYLSWLYLTGRPVELILFTRIIGSPVTLHHAAQFWISGTLYISMLVVFALSLPRFIAGFERPSNKVRNIKWVFVIQSVAMLGAIAVEAAFNSNVTFMVITIPLAFVAGYWFTNYRYSLIAPFVFYVWLFLQLSAAVHAWRAP